MSAMFETGRDPRAARWNRMHEWASQLKMCPSTICNNHTLGMVWYKLTNKYRGLVFMVRPSDTSSWILSSHIILMSVCPLIGWDSYIRHSCGIGILIRQEELYYVVFNTVSQHTTTIIKNINVSCSNQFESTFGKLHYITHYHEFSSSISNLPCCINAVRICVMT